jgi:hypothetical protein
MIEPSRRIRRPARKIRFWDAGAPSVHEARSGGSIEPANIDEVPRVADSADAGLHPIARPSMQTLLRIGEVRNHVDAFRDRPRPEEHRMGRCVDSEDGRISHCSR